MFFASYPFAQFQAHKKEINDSISKTLKSGNYVLGDQVKDFEHSFSKFCNVKYSVGVNSGTDAILLSLKALNIGSGDEVITVSHTALATLSAIISSGAKPVIVDLEKDFLTIDPHKITRAITKKTRAIIPVHIYGQVCDMNKIMKIARENKLYVIEDCAQAVGAEYFGKKVGSIGHVGAFSFYPTKNLGAIGDGGMVTTNNKQIANKISRSRQFGWDKNRSTLEHGQSSRLDELQASILNVKLKYLELENKKRIKLAELYRSSINNPEFQFIKSRKGCKHVYHLFVLKTKKRDLYLNKLKKEGIYCGIHYALPAHKHNGYQKFCKFKNSNLSITNSICNQVITLPMYPELKSREVKKISQIINSLL